MQSRSLTATLATAIVLLFAPTLGASYRENRYCVQPDFWDRWNPDHREIGVLLHQNLVKVCGGHSHSCSGTG
jgi:hypothetical protein